MTDEGLGEKTQYVIFDDGSVRVARYDCELGPRLPTRGRIVSEDEYRDAMAAIQAAVNENRAAVLEQEQQRKRDDYEALRAAGVAEVTARRLSGQDEP